MTGCFISVTQQDEERKLRHGLRLTAATAGGL